MLTAVKNLLYRLIEEKAQGFLDPNLKLLYLGRRNFPNNLIGIGIDYLDNNFVEFIADAEL